MKSFKEGISSFAWQSLNSNPAQTYRTGCKRKLQISSLQPDIDSNDSCHSDSSSSSDVITNKRNYPATNTGHHFIPTPYDKVSYTNILYLYK